jgi:hypothetical protein
MVWDALGKERDEPMDKAELMNSLDRQDTFGHVEFGNVFRERIVLDQPELGPNPTRPCQQTPPYLSHFFL